MTQPDWNARYVAGDSPWDTGEPDANLVDLVRRGVITPGRALEIGCGTGTNSVWLAREGFDVLGLDLSPVAVERARAKAAGVRARFEVADFLEGAPPAGPFHVVLDRGCFHVFDDARVRARFAERVASLLEVGGTWVSLIGSTEGAPREVGPPRRSARDVVTALEPSLELVELRATTFEANLPGDVPPLAWLCLSRRRATPAQPSTQRG